MPTGNAAAHRVTAMAQMLSKQGHDIQIIGLDGKACPWTKLDALSSVSYVQPKIPEE